MFSKLLSATAVALAACNLVAAQTSSACNPAKGDKCPADKAAPANVEIDFTKGASDFFSLAGGTSLSYDKSLGAVFTIKKETDAPTITSKTYIFFGKVDVWVRAANGVGVVTSCVLQSDDLDEIDWEWLGGDTAQVQTNYFSKGDVTTYDRGGFSPIANPQSSVHKYTIDWTSSAVTWLIDDKPVRVLNYNDAKGGTTFPQTPMQLKLGTWVGGRSDAAPGTIQWAGGLTNFANGPFVGYYQKVAITNYSNGVKGATSYVYGDSSGTYGSIVVKTDGSSSGGDDSTTSSSSHSSTKTSSSKTSTKTTHTTAAPTTSSNSTASATGTGSGPTNTGASSTTSSPTTVPTNAAGNLALTVGNTVAMGAALFLGALAL